MGKILDSSLVLSLAIVFIFAMLVLYILKQMSSNAIAELEATIRSQTDLRKVGRKRDEVRKKLLVKELKKQMGRTG